VQLFFPFRLAPGLQSKGTSLADRLPWATAGDHVILLGNHVLCRLSLGGSALSLHRGDMHTHRSRGQTGGPELPASKHLCARHVPPAGGNGPSRILDQAACNHYPAPCRERKGRSGESNGVNAWSQCLAAPKALNVSEHPLHSMSHSTQCTQCLTAPNALNVSQHPMHSNAHSTQCTQCLTAPNALNVSQHPMHSMSRGTQANAMLHRLGGHSPTAFNALNFSVNSVRAIHLPRSRVHPALRESTESTSEPAASPLRGAPSLQ